MSNESDAVSFSTQKPFAKKKLREHGFLRIRLQVDKQRYSEKTTRDREHRAVL